VQLASHPTPEEAWEAVRALRNRGQAAYTSPAEIAGRGTWHRVFVGSHKNLGAAKAAIRKITAGGGQAIAVKLPFAVRVMTEETAAEVASVAADLQSKGVMAYSTEFGRPEAGCWLLVGAFETQARAEPICRQLQAQGIQAQVVRR
jgi:cell division septation protein DedD